MVISGNTLPILAKGPSDQRHYESQGSAVSRDRPASRHATEYVFRADVEEDVLQSRSSKTAYQQQVHPANLTAINRYIDTEVNSPLLPQRQGRLLDIFI